MCRRYVKQSERRLRVLGIYKGTNGLKERLRESNEIVFVIGRKITVVLWE